MGKSDADRLTQATEDARAVLREIRGAIGDMGRVMAEQRALIREEAAATFRAELTAALEPLATATNQAVDDSVASINARFDKIAAILFGLDGNGPPLEQLVLVFARRDLAEQAATVMRAAVQRKLLELHETGTDPEGPEPGEDSEPQQ